MYPPGNSSAFGSQCYQVSIFWVPYILNSIGISSLRFILQTLFSQMVKINIINKKTLVVSTVVEMIYKSNYISRILERLYRYLGKLNTYLLFRLPCSKRNMENLHSGASY